MSRVFTSESTGAVIYVFSADHCPPHVHARHRGDGWIARVRFSYLSEGAELMSVAPLKNSPLQRTVNELLADIEARLPLCRRSWWSIRRTTCLINQWAVVTPAGKFELAAEASVHAKQIAAAAYEADEQQLRVIFQDGTTADVGMAI